LIPDSRQAGRDKPIYVPQAKAILQGIIKAAHVFKDGRIELEFRA